MAKIDVIYTNEFGEPVLHRMQKVVYLKDAKPTGAWRLPEVNEIEWAMFYKRVTKLFINTLPEEYLDSYYEVHKKALNSVGVSAIKTWGELTSPVAKRGALIKAIFENGTAMLPINSRVFAKDAEHTKLVNAGKTDTDIEIEKATEITEKLAAKGKKGKQ